MCSEVICASVTLASTLYCLLWCWGLGCSQGVIINISLVSLLLLLYVYVLLVLLSLLLSLLLLSLLLLLLSHRCRVSLFEYTHGSFLIRRQRGHWEGMQLELSPIRNEPNWKWAMCTSTRRNLAMAPNALVNCAAGLLCCDLQVRGASGAHKNVCL